VPRKDPALVPNGTGDVFSALVAAGLPPGAALGMVQALVAESLGAPHLRIAEAAGIWTRAAAIGPEALTARRPVD
jgi:pyridoxine kinase